MLNSFQRLQWRFDGFLMDFGVDVCKGLWILASKGHGNFKVNDCDEMAWEGIQFIGKGIEGLMVKMQGWRKA